MKKYYITTLIFLQIILLISCKSSTINSETETKKQDSKAVYVSDSFKNISDLQAQLHSISENKTPSVVFIGTEKIIKQRQVDPFDFFFRSPWDDNDRKKNEPKEREFKQQGLGSGVIYSKKGNNYYIITNNHVIEGADKIKITIDQKKYYDGKVLGSDPRVDIAVVSIETKDELVVANFGDSDNLRVGDFVIAIGNPFGLFGTMTFGIVSAIGRTNIDSDRVNLTNFIQTDAAINPGNSGGPLINIDGEVIGINSMIYSQSGGNVGIGFAIPVNVAKRTADQIIDKGKVEHGYIGIYFQELTEESIETLGLKNIKHGMLVNKVFDNSPAEKGGIKSGDVVLEINGKKLYKSSDMVLTIGNMSPGTKINLKISRDGKIIDTSITVGVRDESVFTEQTIEEKGKALRQYGMELSELSSTIREKFNIPKNINGVVVVKIESNSLAAKNELKVGDIITKINNKVVKTPEEIEKIIDENKNQSNYFFIYRDNKEFITMM